MTSHEFPDESFRKERTTFADGTTVTVDWGSGHGRWRPDAGAVKLQVAVLGNAGLVEQLDRQRGAEVGIGPFP